MPLAKEHYPCPTIPCHVIGTSREKMRGRTCDLCNRFSIGLTCAAYPRVYHLRERLFGLMHELCSLPVRICPKLSLLHETGAIPVTAFPIACALTFIACLGVAVFFLYGHDEILAIVALGLAAFLGLWLYFRW